MDVLLDKKVSLVTGSSRGIGRAIALELARHGSDVVINYRKREEEARKVAEEIEKLGRRALVVQADVSDKTQVEGLFKVIDDEFGRLDILVNNAGWGYAAPFKVLEERTWDRTINVNLKSVYLVTQRALELMNPNEYGRIVNITSIAGVLGFGFLSAYSAAKAGIIGLTKSLAQELAGTKITVNAIAAGIVRTKMGESLFQVMGVDEKTWSEKNTLTGRVIEPIEIAKLVVFLSSEYATNITGQVIVVDSGLSLAIFKRMLEI